MKTQTKLETKEKTKILEINLEFDKNGSPLLNGKLNELVRKDMIANPPEIVRADDLGCSSGNGSCSNSSCTGPNTSCN